MKKFMTEEGVLRDIAIPVDYESEPQKNSPYWLD